jgi:hypothetical protein
MEEFQSPSSEKCKVPFYFVFFFGQALGEHTALGKYCSKSVHKTFRRPVWIFRTIKKGTCLLNFNISLWPKALQKCRSWLHKMKFETREVTNVKIMVHRKMARYRLWYTYLIRFFEGMSTLLWSSGQRFVFDSLPNQIFWEVVVLEWGFTQPHKDNWGFTVMKK